MKIEQNLLVHLHQVGNEENDDKHNSFDLPRSVKNHQSPKKKSKMYHLSSLSVSIRPKRVLVTEMHLSY